MYDSRNIQLSYQQRLRCTGGSYNNLAVVVVVVAAGVVTVVKVVEIAVVKVYHMSMAALPVLLSDEDIDNGGNDEIVIILKV